MSDKLTCRMSDGSEWELREHVEFTGGKTGYVLVPIKPIKREPLESTLREPEPFTAWIAYHPEHGIYKHEVMSGGQEMTPAFLNPMVINKEDKFLGWTFWEVEVRPK
jgi:hypothetical protein